MHGKHLLLLVKGETTMSNKETTFNNAARLGKTTMSAKETTLTNAASLMEELSDEALTACVGGTDQPLIQGCAVAAAIWPYYPSDRNIKEHFATVDEQEILAKVVALPIETWNYKEQNPAIRHIGPMAQDFAAAFGVGESDRHINMGDASGVTLAAIQALYKMLLEKDAQITSLRADLDDLKQQAIESKAQTSVVMPAAAFSRN